MNDQDKVLKYLVSVEKLAGEILNDKREMIMLDKRRNHNREALRDINKSIQRKCWITVGSILVKHDFDTTKSLLENDQKQLDIDINKLGSDLKIKINNLRDLEMRPPVQGFMLVPVSKDEKEVMYKTGLIK